MIVAAALCPPAPLLVPGLADDLASELSDLVSACRTAVATLMAVDRVVVLGTRTGSGARCLRPGDAVTSTAFSRSDYPAVPAIRLPTGRGTARGPDLSTDHDGMRGDAGGTGDGLAAWGRSGQTRVAAGTVVAAYLLHGVGITAPTGAVQLAPDSADAAASLAADCAEIDPRDPVERTGLVVMANGSAAHSEHAPGGDDPRSAGFDDDLVTAVASGDPARLAETCRRLAGLAAELHDDTLPALAALGELAVGNGTATADVLHYSAPLGIGYLVATWRWSTP